MPHVVVLRFLAIVLLLCLPFTTHATLNPDHAAQIAGTWYNSEQLPDGRTVSSRVTFAPDAHFTGILLVDGKIAWTFGGTWRVDSGLLHYHYEQSSLPMAEGKPDDTDEILSVDGEKLVLRSRLSGKTHVYQRAR